jgi:CheY-like chemotaxis protein
VERRAAVPGTALEILLAEDNVVNQRLATRMLQKRGHRVTVANNGQEAVELLERSSYDLVLMDVQMPLLDGIAATTLIREREKESGIHQPIVALTAYAVKGDQERCLTAGMDGYLAKPIRPEELDALLQTYWSKRSEAQDSSVPLQP